MRALVQPQARTNYSVKVGVRRCKFEVAVASFKMLK